MSHIHMLSESVWNRIAAGEVVERPASVVKELVENSLDAGATRIMVAVEDAGRKLISVTDNGSGMDEDDAMLCFESHATSKIRNEEDIFAIQSFGFRGEAIPSIASVSKMSIRTRRKDNNSGFEVVVHGGKSINASPVGCAPGTEVMIRDLFYNHPARKKFLKTIATEERHIVECMTNISLAHPEVSFELKLDGRTAFSTPACKDLLPRIREIFGKSCADALIPVQSSDPAAPLQVSGYISTRNYTKATRGEQRAFVNGRPVESPSVFRGIRDGFGPMLEKGKYPVAILFLTMDPGFVDVNVHPAKREVRFRDDFAVTAVVRSAVTAALRAADPVIPQPEHTPQPYHSPYFPTGDAKELPGTKTAQSLYPDFRPGEDTNLPRPTDYTDLGVLMKQALVEYHVQGTARSTPELTTLSELMKQKEAAPAEPSEPVRYFDLTPEILSEPRQEPDVLPFPPDDLHDFPAAKKTQDQMLFDSYKLRVLGIMENSYIIGVIANGLVLIDQHAAHERVLFEKILRGTDGSLSQKLLFPITIELSRADMQFVIRNIREFEKAGFEIDPFGDLTVKLNAIPAALSQDNAGGMFTDMLSRLAERGSAQHLQVHAIATAACKAAVKAHDKLTLEECDALIRELGKCELPFSCPHGRPTVLNISLNEIEHRFGRK
ncbi:MAG: DNA mismatch repair endonuclease MutL [Lentisphaerae bacterium]|nr:DNA mismatch repair endonuclease MutL [Lentisphaerota bacterium]